MRQGEAKGGPKRVLPARIKRHGAKEGGERQKGAQKKCCLTGAGGMEEDEARGGKRGPKKSAACQA